MSTRISVAMAVYNGEKYLGGQMESILRQLGEDDEIVVSVDPSHDESKTIILGYAQRDSRIRVFDGPGCGVIRNFESALSRVAGEYIFLSDQDDVWVQDKLVVGLMELSRDHVAAVVHDAVVTDEALKPMRESFFEGSFQPGVYSNIKKNRYVGCCMAFKKKVLKRALPFPKRLPMHDQWLGMMARKTGSVVYIDKQLILYRRHEQAVTGQKKSNVMRKIIWRVNLLISYIARGLWHGDD